MALHKEYDKKLLTKDVRKKLKKLRIKSILFYVGYLIVFFSITIGAVSYKYGLFKMEEKIDTKINGYIILFIIASLIFGGRKWGIKLKEWVASEHTVIVDQLVILIPLAVTMLFLLFITWKIHEFLFVMGMVLVARGLASFLHVPYLIAQRELTKFEELLERYTKDKGYHGLLKELGDEQLFKLQQ